MKLSEDLRKKIEVQGLNDTFNIIYFIFIFVFVSSQFKVLLKSLPLYTKG